MFFLKFYFCCYSQWKCTARRSSVSRARSATGSRTSSGRWTPSWSGPRTSAGRSSRRAPTCTIQTSPRYSVSFAHGGGDVGVKTTVRFCLLHGRYLSQLSVGNFRSWAGEGKVRTDYNFIRMRPSIWERWMKNWRSLFNFAVYEMATVLFLLWPYLCL